MNAADYVIKEIYSVSLNSSVSRQIRMKFEKILWEKKFLNRIEIIVAIGEFAQYAPIPAIFRFSKACRLHVGKD